MSDGSLMAESAYERAEWLETDGLGGFASGTVSGIRTRRYHALLLVSQHPPVERYVLVNGVYAWVETPHGTYPLTSHRYAPDHVSPELSEQLVFFKSDPWPCWTWQLPDGTTIESEIVLRHEQPTTVLTWRVISPHPERVLLHVRPLLSGRDFHALHFENAQFNFTPELRAGRVIFTPYSGVPSTSLHANGVYTHHSDWFRRFLYIEERERGLDCVEDLASPGWFSFDLTQGDAHLILESQVEPAGFDSAAIRAEGMRAAERQRRSQFGSRLHRAADAYLVRRGESGRTIIAGYPWFGDWGRDTFIALRGLCLATQRRKEAREILLEWADSVQDGLLPNRFPDRGEPPEYNTVDASLWFVLAAHEYLESNAGRKPSAADTKKLQRAVDAIIAGHIRGTRYGIKVDSDGLLLAGELGSNLTWMDARVERVPVTPRWGKPVEIQALWMMALTAQARWSSEHRELLRRGKMSFAAKFWNENGYLYDVIDVAGVPGRFDDTLRPNQILAAGGLPIELLGKDQARAVVDTVERELWTPIGLRSLAPGQPGYSGRYAGGPNERDAVYHQGAVWPWLIGPFVEAWIRSHGDDAEARRKARIVFLEPLLAHLDASGLGHLPEIADGDAPHTPRGCPFQAWSVSEALRLVEVVTAHPARV